MHRLAATLFGLLLLQTAQAGAADILTPRAFTVAFAAAATTAMPNDTVKVVGDLSLETKAPAGNTTSTDLHNAYQVYLADPKALDDVIQRYVALLASTATFSAAKVDRSHIVPLLKPRTWVEALGKQRAATPSKIILSEGFNSDLDVIYAEDLPNAVRMLMTGDDVGDRTKLRGLALANLQRLLPKIEMRSGADGLFLVSAGGEYEASLLLADSIWSSGQIKVEGEIVASVPAKDALIVTGSRNTAGLARLRKLAADLAKGPYALTPALFVYRDGKFIVFDGK